MAASVAAQKILGRAGLALGAVTGSWAIAVRRDTRSSSPKRFVACQDQPPVRKRVCCIGAGAAGLSCAKEMLESGFDATVLEARDGVGGVWRIDTTGKYVGVRRDLRATSSKYYLQFSDFPIPDKAPDFVSNVEYVAYLEDYVERFKLRDHIRFQHETLAVRPSPHGGWEVDVASKRGVKTERFDAVAVCSGLHSTPDFPAQGAPVPPAGFRAKVLHSRDLKDARSQLKGKRIVVVGGGETGADFAHVAATVGSGPAFLSLRRGMTVIGPYLPFPLSDRVPDARTPPVDLNERRVLSLLPPAWKHFVFTRDKEAIFALREQNPGKHTVGRLMDRTLNAVGSLVIVPFFIAGSAAADIFHELTHPEFWRLSKPDFQQPDGPKLSQEMHAATCLPRSPAVRMQRNTDQLLEYTRRAAWFRMQGYTTWHYQQVRSLLEEYSGARHTQNFLTKSDDFIYNLLDRSLELRPAVAGYEGKETVVFEDGSRADVDVVVWCSGYQPRVPFLSELLNGEGDKCGSSASEGHVDGQELYKNVFHPTLGDTLAFIGFARPQLGAMPPIAELQGRWFGAVLRGEVQLPNAEKMAAEIVEDTAAYSAKIFSQRLRSTVDFVKYTSDIALRAGCYPDMGIAKMLTDFELWWAFWFGPAVPQSYRIADQGEKGSEARAYLKSIYLTFFTRS